MAHKSLHHPFRIFFPLTALSTLVALLPWMVLNIVPQYAGYFPLHWHAYSFIHIVSGAAFAGFLLTALPSWCHWRPRAMPLISITLTTLWSGAVLLLPYPALGNLFIICFWLTLFIVSSTLIIRSHTWKQSSFLFVLIGIIMLAISYAVYPTGRILHATVDIMIIGVALANFRIGRVIGNQALSDAGKTDYLFIPNPYYKNISCLVLGGAAIGSLFLTPTTQAWLYFATAFAFAARLNDWHHWVLLKQPYVRAHYTVSLALSIGYFFLALALLKQPAWFSYARHFIAICAFLLMIMTVMSIAGLRHSGQQLVFARSTRFAMSLLVAAALSRSLFAYLYPGMTTIYRIPTVLIGSAFLLYLYYYCRIFRRYDPR